MKFHFRSICEMNAVFEESKLFLSQKNLISKAVFPVL